MDGEFIVWVVGLEDVIRTQEDRVSNRDGRAFFVARSAHQREQAHTGIPAGIPWCTSSASPHGWGRAAPGASAQLRSSS